MTVSSGSRAQYIVFKTYHKETHFLSYEIMAISATIDTAAAVADDDVLYIYIYIYIYIIP